jgi:hypothetical protein
MNSPPRQRYQAITVEQIRSALAQPGGFGWRDLRIGD